MFIFYEFRPFCIDNARVIYRKIRYIILLHPLLLTFYWQQEWTWYDRWKFWQIMEDTRPRIRKNQL